MSYCEGCARRDDELARLQALARGEIVDAQPLEWIDNAPAEALRTEVIAHAAANRRNAQRLDALEAQHEAAQRADTETINALNEAIYGAQREIERLQEALADAREIAKKMVTTLMEEQTDVDVDYDGDEIDLARSVIAECNRLALGLTQVSAERDALTAQHEAALREIGKVIGWEPGEKSLLQAVKDEWHDFMMVVRHCSVIYDAASGGRISKPQTLPEEVIRAMEDRENEDIEEAIAEARSEIKRLKGLGVPSDQVPEDPRYVIGYQRQQWNYWQQRAETAEAQARVLREALEQVEHELERDGVNAVDIAKTGLVGHIFQGLLNKLRRHVDLATPPAPAGEEGRG